MTKKDYELIAGVFYFPESHKEGWSKDTKAAHEAMALNIADALAEDNPRFDRERFLEACGLNP